MGVGFFPPSWCIEPRTLCMLDKPSAAELPLGLKVGFHITFSVVSITGTGGLVLGGPGGGVLSEVMPT